MKRLWIVPLAVLITLMLLGFGPGSLVGALAIGIFWGAFFAPWIFKS